MFEGIIGISAELCDGVDESTGQELAERVGERDPIKELASSDTCFTKTREGTYVTASSGILVEVTVGDRGASWVAHTFARVPKGREAEYCALAKHLTVFAISDGTVEVSKGEVVVALEDRRRLQLSGRTIDSLVSSLVQDARTVATAFGSLALNHSLGKAARAGVNGLRRLGL